MCLSSPFSPPLAAPGGWQGAERLHYRFQITGCQEQVRGLHVSAPWRGASLTTLASFPNFCSTSPAWICCTSFKWIYGPINGESLCIIKSRTDLSGIQFNNYLSNSIIFRYVVSVSADLEDPLGAFDGQESTFNCSVTKSVLHRPCTHLFDISKLQKDCVQVWSVYLSLDWEEDVQRTSTCTSPYLRTSPQASSEKCLPLCSDRWFI